MANNIVMLDEKRRELESMRGEFNAVIARSGMDLARFIQSVMWALEHNAKLGDCTIDSIKRFGMTAASLVLDPNPETQQIFAIPFRDGRRGVTVAATVIGYRGYNTIAWRDGITVTGGVVRAEDQFTYDEGSGHVSHVKKLGHWSERPIIGAWARAAAEGRQPILKVLDIDELEEVRKASPAVRTHADSPWNNPRFLPAMYEKTAKRRLARSMPMGAYLIAARLDEAFEERGLVGHVDPERGLVIGDQAEPLVRAQPQPEQPQDLVHEPEFYIYTSADHSKRRVCQTVPEWRAKMLEIVDRLSPLLLEQFEQWNIEMMDDMRNSGDAGRDAADVVGNAIRRKLKG